MARVPKPVSWVASPFAYGSARVAAASRRRVLAGPFAGMRYPASFVARGLFGGPYQVGSFELELWPAIERIAATGPATVVNVGVAEGYYAVGLATRLPASRVIGFELDPRLRAAASKLAELNGVAERVELRGLCTVAELAALDDRSRAGEAVVIMDCEGAEAELADPERVPWLRDATIVVELHPAIDPRIEARLLERFARTHELVAIRSEVRRASDFDAQLRPIGGLRRIDRELLVAEFRDGPMDWLWATPRR
jgi:predicted O-methyltransferase YrrM